MYVNVCACARARAGGMGSILEGQCVCVCMPPVLDDTVFPFTCGYVILINRGACVLVCNCREDCDFYVFLPPCTRIDRHSVWRARRCCCSLVRVAASLKCNVWFVCLLLSFLHFPELSRIICRIYRLEGWRLVLV